MSGNVWEWCLDEHESEILEKIPDNFPNPIFEKGNVSNINKIIFKYRKQDKTLHVLRGGSWSIRFNNCDVEYHGNSSAYVDSNSYGFRLYKAYSF